MDLDQKVAPAVYIRLLTDLFRQWDITPEELLAGTGITPANLQDPNYFLTLRQEIAAYERAEDLSPAPEWALLAGQATNVQTHGVAGYAMLTSADFKQVLQVSVRFYKLSGTASVAELWEHSNGDYEVRLVDTLHRPKAHRCVQEEFLSALLIGLQEVSRKACKPKRLNLDYSAPTYSALYREMFDCPVQFDAEHTGLVFDQQDLSLRIPTWDPLTSEACRRQCEQVLEKLTEAEGFVDTVRKVMLVQPCDRRSAKHVAEELHTSTRNLRRKLEQEGTSFQKVLDDVRCELAKNYLSQTTLRLEDIAPLLGFSETSNLRRAFKKWTQQTPSEYRDGQSCAA